MRKSTILLILKYFYMSKDGLYLSKDLKNICYIKNVVNGKNVIMGDYTYYNTTKDPRDFEKDCITYHYEFLKDRLIIGKFCSLGENIKFLMNAANHNFNAISTYPFTAILNDSNKINTKHLNELPNKGDTVIGNDVWIGENVTILPGIHIGDGAIIGANSVVSKNVKPYTVVACNPIKEIRKRFTEEQIEVLEKIKWWDWDINKILSNLDVILSSDIDKLAKI